MPSQRPSGESCTFGHDDRSSPSPKIFASAAGSRAQAVQVDVRGGTAPRRPAPCRAPGSACSRSRCRRAARPASRRGCAGSCRRGRWPLATSRTRRVELLVAARARRRRRARAPSSDGYHQSSAAVPSAAIWLTSTSDAILAARARRARRAPAGSACRRAACRRGAPFCPWVRTTGAPSEPVSCHRHRRSSSQAAPGNRVQALAQVAVLRRRPRPHLGGVAVLQPAVGIAHLHAVELLHHVLDARRGRRGQQGESHDRQHFLSRPSGHETFDDGRQRQQRQARGEGRDHEHQEEVGLPAEQVEEMALLDLLDRAGDEAPPTDPR